MVTYKGGIILINYHEFLSKTKLFQNVPNEEIQTHIRLKKCFINTYTKGALIAREKEVCAALGIVVNGTITIEHLTAKGTATTVSKLHAHDSFGEALLFAKNNQYPYHIVSQAHSKILFIPFEQIQGLLANSATFCNNYLTCLSNRLQQFKFKVAILTEKSVRTRLILYLANEYNKHGQLTFPLVHTKTEVADIIGVARPSLSRELAKMQRDGLLKVFGNQISIINIDLVDMANSEDDNYSPR